MSNLLTLRLAKLWFAACHPRCWPALARGVAPSLEHRAFLANVACDGLIDVGANRGQFSLMTRLLHPQLPIHAFEPLPSEAAVYRQLLGRHPGVVLHAMALGEQDGTADLHVSRRADSSSLLPLGELQAKLFPQTDEVGVHQVRVARLDALPEVWQGYSRALLKLDVQGFELSVLRGASEALRHCAWVYAECSEVPLYVGQALFPEVREFLAGHGFTPVARYNEQYADGRLIQADHLFAAGQKNAG